MSYSLLGVSPREFDPHSYQILLPFGAVFAFCFLRVRGASVEGWAIEAPELFCNCEAGERAVWMQEEASIRERQLRNHDVCTDLEEP
ncbi:hypothetical protein BC567DRAFT_231912 [Phyllosticta citribraziliensis]